MDFLNVKAARKGYELNKMFYSFNAAENRAAFLADPEGYCDRYKLNAEEREAALSRDRRKIVAAGGNMYFFQKFERIPKPDAATGAKEH